MESITVVLRLFSCFFSRAPAAFPLGPGVHQNVGSSRAGTVSPPSCTLGTQVKRKSHKKYSTS